MLCCVWVLALSVTAPAPASNTTSGELADSPAASVDAELLERTAELAEQGQVRFETSDYAGAIEIWTTAYAELPDEPGYAAARATLLVYLAHAHVQAFEIDREVEHLRKASVLFTAYLRTLDPADELNRAKIQAELDIIAPLIETAEDAAELARTRTEREAQARELQAREDAAREAELARARERDSVAARAERASRRTMIAGASLTGLGVLTTGVMIAGLGLGAGVERRGEQAKLEPATPMTTYVELRRQGTAYNQMAWTSGIIAGTLLIAGIATIAKATTIRRTHAGRNAALRLRPGLNGLEWCF